MLYSVRHLTRFTYQTPIAESVMEARMQPRSEGNQRLAHFRLSTVPESRVLMYQDREGNTVHHFDIPGRHERLTVSAEALVDCGSVPGVPLWLDPESWERLDLLTSTGQFWDYLNPSRFAAPTPLLAELAEELGLERGDDPLGALRRLIGEISLCFEYSPQSTRVDSPIDDALKNRRGVCQDFAHIFITLARGIGIPCRYVSGYLGRGKEGDRSADAASHAWAEAYLPDLGWTGFDPTNNLLAGDRHIRVAIGRDYADVPPTRGVYKGTSVVLSELAVSVRVGSAGADEMTSFGPLTSSAAVEPVDGSDANQQQ